MTERADPIVSRPWLGAQAARRPDGLALVDVDGRAVHFGDLAASAEALARRLRGAGCGPGARIAALMNPCRRFVELIHAAQQLGVALVPLNDRLQTDELAAQVLNADPAWLLYDDEHAEPAHALCARVPALRPVGAAGDLGRLPASRGALPDHVDPQALHSIIYTSGTTGAAKGVVLTNANHYASATASMQRLGQHADDVWLSPLPLYHVGGLSIPLRAALGGFAVMLMRRFDADAVDRALRTQRVTLLSLVPTMLVRLLDAAGDARVPPGVRCALIGGGGCPPDLIARARAHGIPAVPTYGMTEAASQICTADADDIATAPGSVGRPLAGLDLRVLDPDATGWGQIAVRGPQITPGYFRNTEATAHAFDGGWLRTGDIGRVDDAGRVWVLGRGADLVVTGGEKVVPEEVEAALATHPSVQEAAVYGVPDPLWGERVAAAVVLRPGAELAPADLRAWCRRRVAGFKVPRQFQVVPTLPRTASGKVQRHLLRS